MTRAILSEIDLTRNFLPSGTIETIYFGGGTPSLLPVEVIAGLLGRVREVYGASSGAGAKLALDVEVTLEANPDDVDRPRLAAWKSAGINRLSLGVQSFRDEELRWMNRVHSADQALNACHAIADTGFTDYSIDLIYGVPGQTDKAWTQNLDLAIKLGPNHLSCYALTVEPGTALGTAVRKGTLSDTDPEQQARQFLLMADQLAGAGFEQYEVSNFARAGHRSRHNSAYWLGAPYLGLGPSAHSFKGRTRRWNVSNNALYAQALMQGQVPFESEVLTSAQRLNEYIMTSLRTIEGCDLGRITGEWGQAAGDAIRERAKKHARLTGDRVLRLTREGLLFADGIAADLFFVEGDVALVDLELPEDVSQDRHPDHDQDTRGAEACE